MTEGKEEYDPLRWETWPEEQREAAIQANKGVLDGDLRPLADYLRRGYYINAPLANEIILAIECSEYSPCHIVTKRRERGGKTWSQTSEASDRKIRIGFFMEKRLRELPKGSYDSVLIEVKEQFDVGHQTAATALDFFRNDLARNQSDENFPMDWWDWYERHYST